MGCDDLDTRSLHQVKRVAENHLGPQRLELLRGHGLDAAVGADGHEGGRLDAAAHEHEPAAPGRTFLSQQLEPHQRAAACVISMASP